MASIARIRMRHAHVRRDESTQRRTVLFRLASTVRRFLLLLATLAGEVHSLLNRFRAVLLHQLLHLGEGRAEFLLNGGKITLFHVFGRSVDTRGELVEHRSDGLLVQRDGAFEARIHHPRDE